MADQVAENAVARVLSQRNYPTAIFAHSDLTAIALLRKVQKRGLQVPGDISIMGFDNTPLAPLMNPSLTTIGQPIYRMGVKAAKLIMDCIETRDNSRKRIILDTQLIIRESTGKPKNSIS